MNESMNINHTSYKQQITWNEQSTNSVGDTA